MILTKSELEDLLNTHADRLRASGVERIGIFGTIARGEQNADSDLDVLAGFRPGQESFGDFVELADFLESQTGRRVALLPPNSLSARLKERTLSQVEYVVLHTA